MFLLQSEICFIVLYNQIVKTNNQIIKMNNQIVKITIKGIRPRLACFGGNTGFEISVSELTLTPNFSFM